ncbi:MAG: hypothetical protein A2Y12_10440 [Planctomycetes bacterium GWF2_42_9]|nr:MAG: hypothetical protein A2Y12_10440 [Planctomycetes bacterium GWF2_42_9]
MQTVGNSKRGFTLVELLVVISIIALLLAILMPSLQKARAQAGGVVCGSNQKQVVMAMLLYAEDSDGRVPYFQNPLWVASKKAYFVTKDGWLGAILPYVKGSKPETMKFQGVTYYTEKAFSAIGNCPLMRDPTSKNKPWSIGVNYPNVIGYSGKLTAAAGGDPSYVSQFRWEPLKMAQIPSGTMVFMDAGVWKWWVYNMARYPLNSGTKDDEGIYMYNSDIQAQGMRIEYNGATFPHNNTSNIALVNGSVVRLPKKEICANAGDIWGSKLKFP